MKKNFYIILSIFFLFISILFLPSKTISCNKNNIEEKIDNIINPKNGWPPTNYNFYTVWENFYAKSNKSVSECISNIINDYSNFYYGEYLKYKNGKRTPDTDSYNVPLKDIENYKIELANSDNMRLFTAYSAQNFFIEMNINKIVNNIYSLNENEYLNLWSMVYFKSMPVYEWAKIILWDLGVIYETGIDFNFLGDKDHDHFSHFLQEDDAGNILWNKGPTENPNTFRNKYITIGNDVYSFCKKNIYNKIFE